MKDITRSKYNKITIKYKVYKFYPEIYNNNEKLVNKS